MGLCFKAPKPPKSIANTIDYSESSVFVVMKRVRDNNDACHDGTTWSICTMVLEEVVTSLLPLAPTSYDLVSLP